MKTHGKRDTVILAVTLFLISGVSLGYNLATINGDAVSVSLGDLIGGGAPAISASAQAHFAEGDSIPVGASPTVPPETEALLPPIVTPPVK